MSSVLQVLPSFHAGGVEQTTLSVANALAERGLRSFVASASGILTKKLHPKVTHIEMPLGSKNPYIMFKNFKRLKKIIEAYRIDIVHARSRAPAWSAYFAAKSTKAHFLTTYHSAYSQNFLKWYYNRVMAMGKIVIIASNYMEKHVKKYYPDIKSVQIASGINTQFFSPEHIDQQRIGDLKTLWETDENSKIILLVGRFSPIKGHHKLLQAVDKSIFKNNIKVIFVGDTKNPKLVDILRKQASECGIKLYVYLDESDIRSFFSLADVVVVPTIKPEAFGRVTVEAMSMENIVIVNDLGASKEIVNDRRWVFDYSDMEDFRKKIDEALSLKPKEKSIIGAKNRLRALTSYDIENLIESHLQLYKGFFKAE